MIYLKKINNFPIKTFLYVVNLSVVSLFEKREYFVKKYQPYLRNL